MKKRVKDYNIILYDYFAKVFGERIASIIIIPSAIIILGIIGYGIMLCFGVFRPVSPPQRIKTPQKKLSINIFDNELSKIFYIWVNLQTQTSHASYRIK